MISPNASVRATLWRLTAFEVEVSGAVRVSVLAEQGVVGLALLVWFAVHEAEEK